MYMYMYVYMYIHKAVPHIQWNMCRSVHTFCCDSHYNFLIHM